ncbi:hypothetical protein [Methylobacterium oryzae]|uniref:Uncharacterized protein n=1 Tax=Methylobacterium oryzae TaxID=334852 RepID=A0ABU7TRA0_9HYPH
MDRLRAFGRWIAATRFMRWARRYDWRVWTIVLALAISVVVTAAIYWRYGIPSPDTHWGSVFASWVGGVALFLVVGVASAITSAARPEMESFDTRARILFRKQSGRHIDYIVGRVHQVLEHYADTTHRRVVVSEYHEGERKFLVSVETAVSVRSYIDDVPSSYASSIRIKEVTAAPPGRANRLVYLRADDRSLGAGTEIVDLVDKPFETTIQAGCPCIVKNKWERGSPPIRSRAGSGRPGIRRRCFSKSRTTFTMAARSSSDSTMVTTSLMN